MIHLRQPNRYSCIACAFAMALDISYEEIVKLVGHDGSKPHPFSGKPFGIHIQELIEVAVSLGYAVTPIDALPAGIQRIDDTPILLWDDDRRRLRFMSHLRDCRGVIECQCVSGAGHAVANDHGIIYDPDADVVKPFDDNDFPYIITCLWRIDRTCRS